MSTLPKKIEEQLANLAHYGDRPSYAARLRVAMIAALARAEIASDVVDEDDLGAGYSEEDIRANGYCFGSWEAGFSTAVTVIRERINARRAALAKAVQP